MMRSQIRVRHIKPICLSNRPLIYLHSLRAVHLSSRHHAAAGLPRTPSPVQTASDMLSSRRPSPPNEISQASPPLARLPISSVIRSYLITRMSSSPPLLTLCFSILRLMLSSKSLLFSLDRNPILAKLLKSTFYAQFCIGETKEEVVRNTSVAERAKLGYDGIILEYSLEVLEGEGEEGKEVTEEQTRREVDHWLKGMMQSVEMAREGDFVGLKWSGIGRHALSLLKSNAPPTPLISTAIETVCFAAASKNISLLPGAEEESTNPGIEAWNRLLQRQFNTPAQGRAVLYTTYQCYLQAAPERIAAHLKDAKEHGYIAGVKLVRGAYLDTEKARGVPVWESWEGTNACYDGLAEAVLKREWTGFLAPYAPASTDAEKTFPEVNTVLATHNAASVRKVLKLRQQQALEQSLSPSSPPLPRLSYAQLQGMADEISLDLVASGQEKGVLDRPRVYKCMTWGTTTECLNYLLRRANENKDAMGRTVETRKAMGRELMRRMKAVMGLGA
ncbi:proline oxidase-like protein [Delitschia confertaspora ATCC 74209]|uniref:Proline dehydrogenase n=1 Tax=Delitschia confertaspora ATCC 74209 TaxID=1513339 RepID=A0A9P4JSR8_9PLEO|nr:proline oxidase-like protein [Delitschia confertaspora ATCC 74209]